MVNRYEMEELHKKKDEVTERAEKVLRNLLGEKRSLTWLSLKDKLRLTILLTWEERYHVTVEEILLYLLPLFQKLAKTKKRTPKGFPVRVTTLVSRTTEDLLKEYLQKMYPEGSLEKLERYYRQESKLKPPKEDDGIVVKPRRLETLADYRDAYDRRIQAVRERRRRQTQRKTLPYRGSL